MLTSSYKFDKSVFKLVSPQDYSCHMDSSSDANLQSVCNLRQLSVILWK